MASLVSNKEDDAVVHHHHQKVHDSDEPSSKGEDQSLLSSSSLSALSLLRSLVNDPTTTISNAMTSRQTRQRQEYEERLLTFQAVTYWAKPACLSPIVCARFGWCNADRDMLVCSSCGSAVAILFHHNLSTKAATFISKSYRQQLATAHTVECPFRPEAEKYLIREETGEPTLVIPMPFSSFVFPPETVELMEHPFPRSLLRTQIGHLEDSLRRAVAKHPAQETDQSQQQQQQERGHEQQDEALAWHYPKVEVPPELSGFQLPQATRHETWNMVGEACKIIGTGDITTTALSLLGWTAISAEEDEANTHTHTLQSKRGVGGGIGSSPVVSLGCPICLAWMDLSLTKEDGPSSPVVIVHDDSLSEEVDNEQQEGQSTITNPKSKRRRVSNKSPNPLGAHRHYCPWVCGFPTQYSSTSSSNVPVWKIIATRLLEEHQKATVVKYPNTSSSIHSTTVSGDDEEGDLTFERLCHILQSGIASGAKTAAQVFET